MQKKILLNLIIPNGGGPAFTFGLAKGLKANGCEVFFVLSDKLIGREKWEEEFGREHIFYVVTHTSVKNLIPRYAKFLLKTKRELKTKFKGIQFDAVIHTMYHSWNDDVQKCVKAKRILAVNHDPLPHSGVKQRRGERCIAYYNRIPELIILSKAFEEILVREFGRDKKTIHYMPHGRMDSYNTDKPVHGIVGRDETKTNFLFFGFIVEYKGLSVLAKAYKKVAAKNPNVSLTIAANGDFSPYAEDYRDLPNFLLVNEYIPDEEIPSYFSMPNAVAVLPYLDATQSGVIPIAMEHGVPVVATKTGGLVEQLDDGKIGILCEAKDADSLAAAMLTIAEDKAEYARQSALMRGYLKKLDWEYVAKGLLDKLELE
ncbi:MAG: glycosyltransferase family 4 protein [Clostridia bacterium]|nr:glycosyltransferase family 4 protein [Clostridia bacterium]